MFKNSEGKLVPKEASIFPLITFDPKSKVFNCVGTGFFITPFGGFVTAKHVFFKNDGTHRPTLYGVQSLEDGTRVVRTLKHLVVHPNADIAIGMLGDAKNNDRFNQNPVPASAFCLSFQPLQTGDAISTYAFPNTQNEWLDDDHQQFTFQGVWSSGIVEDFHPNGMGLLRNACYQTTMKIDGGASGGPVLHNATVVAVNSTGMDLGDVAISSLTPVTFLKDLSVPSENGNIPIPDLIAGGYITVI
ncbi:S1 family peptidase [Chitinophaga sancti]|uniref:Serine protease n=1 Tax=Chitinophaga sancti TaxID=1004 RepID=A0A1K1SER2_9BACT|nr:serine protease [Chitinophaga sancti]WQD60022.1 serine protease [Chitinophaga sancti]WQG87848.1 serine protease [Chitinophaga sancti]SFW82754.1 Trypsin-like peptidase domain-containing protein [Chitinophaga sancti]